MTEEETKAQKARNLPKGTQLVHGKACGSWCPLSPGLLPWLPHCPSFCPAPSNSSAALPPPVVSLEPTPALWASVAPPFPQGEGHAVIRAALPSCKSHRLGPLHPGLPSLTPCCPPRNLSPGLLPVSQSSSHRPLLPITAALPTARALAWSDEVPEGRGCILFVFPPCCLHRNWLVWRNLPFCLFILSTQSASWCQDPPRPSPTGMGLIPQGGLG